MFVFGKVNILLFSSECVVCGQVGWYVVGGSVVGGFNKTHYKNCYI